MTESPVYRIHDIHKSHGTGFTLHIDDLRVARGEVLGLLGPTGSGKSTLLRLLSGLQSADAGVIDFEGRRLTENQLSLADRRRIALVHQRPLLLTGTVQFNVEYGLRLRKVQPTVQTVERMLKRLGLGGLAFRSARTLSGGQEQLVALARAIAIEPDVLLLDEPTANLDPAHVALVEQTIRDIQQDRSMTIVWATHNLFQARRVASRTALLLNGQLIEAAPTEAFFESPTDPRTADFVQGRMVY